MAQYISEEVRRGIEITHLTKHGGAEQRGIDLADPVYVEALMRLNLVIARRGFW